jgi:hypothetical protein
MEFRSLKDVHELLHVRLWTVKNCWMLWELTVAAPKNIENSIAAAKDG